MHFSSIIMFILSSNVDNLVLGLSYGLKGIRIGLWSNLLVGAITMVGTVVSMGLGKLLLSVLPQGVAVRLGSLAVLLIGLWFLREWFLKQQGCRDCGPWNGEAAERFDRDCSKIIEPREAIALGVALTVNNIGLGIGASAMGLGVFMTSIGSCLCSLLCLYIGNRAGQGWLSRVLGQYAELWAGLLVVFMGLCGLLFQS